MILCILHAALALAIMYGKARHLELKSNRTFSASSEYYYRHHGGHAFNSFLGARLLYVEYSLPSNRSEAKSISWQHGGLHNGPSTWVPEHAFVLPQASDSLCFFDGVSLHIEHPLR